MKPAEISKLALSFYTAHGDAAEAEAAQKASAAETAGDAAEAATWRAVRKAIMQMRGPRES